MTDILMQFLPVELVHKIDHETHKVRLADVMFQNQRRYWQKQHKDELSELFGDGDYTEFEDALTDSVGVFWENAGKTDDEVNQFDWGLNSGRYYWGRGRFNAAGIYTKEKLEMYPLDKRGKWMWEEYDEYILQEPHPEIIKVDCGLCCGCKWGTKCLR